MNKRLLWLVTLLFLATGTFAESQQKMYRVGVIMLGGADIPEIKGLRDGLKEAGYVEGKTLS
jgi:hypothetical protein